MTHYRPKGFVLVLVLGTVMALCVLLVGFSHSARRSLAQADGLYRSQQAYQSAWAGLQVACALVRDANDAGLDPRLMNPAARDRAFAVGDANCTLLLTGESGLLNVNRLLAADGQPDRAHVEQLLRLLDALNRQDSNEPPIGYGLVPALIDWIDSDDEPTCLPFLQQDNLGAENAYYQMRTPPLACRNGPVEVLGELAAVKGMTPEAFARLRPYLTCVGEGKIDLNAAPKLLLQSLSEQMDATLAELLIRRRTLRPLSDLAELRTVPGLTESLGREIEALATVRPRERYYRVKSQGSAQGHSTTIEAVIRRSTPGLAVDIIQYREF